MMFEVAPNFLQSRPIRQAVHVALDSVWQQLGQWTSTHSGFVRRIVHGHKRRGDAFSLQQLVARTTRFRPLWTHALPCLRYACLTRLHAFGLYVLNVFYLCFVLNAQVSLQTRGPTRPPPVICVDVPKQLLLFSSRAPSASRAPALHVWRDAASATLTSATSAYEPSKNQDGVTNVNV